MRTELWEVNPIAAYPPARTGSRARTRDPERRNRILAAAADLVARKGFHTVSVAAVDHAIQIHGGNGLSAEYGLVPQWGLARPLRTAPVSSEMILNYVVQQSLSLPRSY
jgi:alkylation response protein AidB-like acyl-CoA dehydrogenase